MLTEIVVPVMEEVPPVSTSQVNRLVCWQGNGNSHFSYISTDVLGAELMPNRSCYVSVL